VNYGQDLDSVSYQPVDDAIPLNDELTNFWSAEFRNYPTRFGETLQAFHRYAYTTSERCRIAV